MSEDALGTVKGRCGEGRRLLIGSHIDTVIDAGKYDGPFGVVAGILAAEHFIKAGQRLPFGIDVLAFGDEEGSRFPSTHSSAVGLRGRVRAGTLELADRNGMTFADALKAYGKNARRYLRCRLPPARTWPVRRAAHRAGAGAGGEEPAARRRHRHLRPDQAARHRHRRSRSRRHRADGAAPRRAGRRGGNGAGAGRIAKRADPGWHGRHGWPHRGAARRGQHHPGHGDASPSTCAR